MSTYTEEELIQYVWKHYQTLIDEECDYISMVRAHTFHRLPASQRPKFLQHKDQKYLAWPLERLRAELLLFAGSKGKEIALAVSRKHADRIYLNVCTSCGKLPASPQAEYCIHCRHSWQGENPLRLRQKSSE